MQLDSILEKFDSVEAQLISLQETIIARGKHSTELKIKYEDAEILISKLDSIDKIKVTVVLFWARFDVFNLR